MTDFLIVGRGLAATTLMHVLHRKRLTFKVIGQPHLSNCSRVAAGIWNPVVFKRLTKSWMAEELLAGLNKFYRDCEITLGRSLVTSRDIIRPFSEVQEETLWIKKSKNELADFLDPRIYAGREAPGDLKIEGNFGRVKGCGNLHMKDFLEGSAEYFKDHLFETTFDHRSLQINAEDYVYGPQQARSIIFCEGYLLKNNPFFNWVPLKPAKGEVLIVQIRGLEPDEAIFNKGAYLMKLGDGTYKLGATYEWTDLDENCTDRARAELTGKLSNMTTRNFEVLKQEAGIRPSSSDRRPVIGPHPAHHNMFIFNGLGTKGVMLAPYFANNFVNFYLQKQALNSEVTVKRFYHLYEEKN